jgi:glycine cleavage system regulatory protein
VPDHYPACMATLVLTVLGDDRPGLVSAVSAALDAHGAGWERSQLARLAGKFAGVVEVTAPDSAVDALVPALEALAASGLTVVVERTDATVADGPAPDPAAAAAPRRLVLDLVGADRPGIVASISSLLADQDISVEQFRSQVQDAPMAGGTLFEAHAVLVAPAALSTGDLRATLETLADELLVDIELAEDPSAH